MPRVSIADVRVRPAIPLLSLQSYAIQADDSLSDIAYRFGVNLDTLISVNAVHDISDMTEGVELSIPNASGIYYSVRSGDTLSNIAADYGLRLADLLDWNELETATIVVGQKLFIPGASLASDERNDVLGRLFLKPAPGTITALYGHHPDPVTGIGRFHDGIDIQHTAGTAVTASMSGRVGRVGVNGNYGRYLVLVHADGYQTLYAELSRVSLGADSFVDQGEVVGTMGSIGYGESGRLHFSIFKDGEPVDPKRYLH